MREILIRQSPHFDRNDFAKEKAMSANNITHEVNAMFVSPAPCFQVQAISKIITTRGRRISPGDVIVIDPLAIPTDDQMVIVGDSIHPFAGQLHGGVVTGFMSEAI